MPMSRAICGSLLGLTRTRNKSPTMPSSLKPIPKPIKRI